VIDQLRQHHQRDGGFSYHVDRSQTNYYGVPIAQGPKESDLQATCLLSWALALCERIIDQPLIHWNLIKP